MPEAPLSGRSDFSLGSCQATVFTPDEEISVNKLMRDLFPSWANRFDAEPVVLPSVDGFPRDVPRLILENKSREWRCEIASARVNLFWRSQETAGVSIDEFAAVASSVLSGYMDFSQSRIGRIGFLRSVYAEHPEPGIFLARHFCQEQWQIAPFNRPENFELHAHKRFSLAGRWLVNSWVRNKSGRITRNEVERPAVLVDQDLNTLADDAQGRSFSASEVSDFLASSATEFTSILRLYYPNRAG